MVWALTQMWAKAAFAHKHDPACKGMKGVYKVFKDPKMENLIAEELQAVEVAGAIIKAFNAFNDLQGGEWHVPYLALSLIEFTDGLEPSCCPF